MANCSRNAEPLPISHLLRQDTASILHPVPTLSSNPGGSESILERRPNRVPQVGVFNPGNAHRRFDFPDHYTAIFGRRLAKLVAFSKA